MTLYGYAKVSVREPEDKNLELQVERLVRAGCAMSNIRAEEASGPKDDRGGLLELLDLVDLVVEGDTLTVYSTYLAFWGRTFPLWTEGSAHHFWARRRTPSRRPRRNPAGRTPLKLDFTHFKRHKRGNLQYDGTEWRGVSVHRSWRSIVKNPPTPTTSGYAQR